MSIKAKWTSNQPPPSPPPENLSTSNSADGMWPEWENVPAHHLPLLFLLLRLENLSPRPYCSSSSRELIKWLKCILKGQSDKILLDLHYFHRLNPLWPLASRLKYFWFWFGFCWVIHIFQKYPRGTIPWRSIFPRVWYPPASQYPRGGLASQLLKFLLNSTQGMIPRGVSFF